MKEPFGKRPMAAPVGAFMSSWASRRRYSNSKFSSMFARVSPATPPQTTMILRVIGRFDGMLLAVQRWFSIQYSLSVLPHGQYVDDVDRN